MTFSVHTAPLRFITAGSVDDGKSTLIGRLLYDSKALPADQIARLHKNRIGDAVDFSVLTDGLEAEREQGITIDVAYRYFATSRRKFIIADTPGHEQYTRNMVTGASTADAAVVVLDASQLDFSQDIPELLPQTKRHSAILYHLHCPHIVVVVNKMDLLDYREDRFNAVVRAYRVLADHLGLADVHFVPISALYGDNIVTSGQRMPWYHGATLLQLLEKLPARVVAPQPLYLPVQYVLRTDGTKQDDFRGYQGTVAAGSIGSGDAIRVGISGQRSVVREVMTLNGLDKRAQAGEAIIVRLIDDVDVSRGDVLLADDSPLQPIRNLGTTVCWFDAKALNPSRKYLIKHGTETVFAKVHRIVKVWDVHTLSHVHKQQTLNMNDLGEVEWVLQKPLLCTPYAVNKTTGAFIVIDEATNHTVAAAMVLDPVEASG